MQALFSGIVYLFKNLIPFTWQLTWHLPFLMCPLPTQLLLNSISVTNHLTFVNRFLVLRTENLTLY